MLAFISSKSILVALLAPRGVPSSKPLRHPARPAGTHGTIRLAKCARAISGERERRVRGRQGGHPFRLDLVSTISTHVRGGNVACATEGAVRVGGGGADAH